MGLSLVKGQRISLSKTGGASLRTISVGLGWGKRTVTEFKKKGGFLGIGGKMQEVTSKHSVDLDASCILYNSSKKATDSVWWKQLRSQDGSILHTGDDLVGGGSEQEPNEVIKLDLQKVPADVASIVFVVNSYSGHTFEGIPFAFCNVVDDSTRKEIARYNLSTEGGNYQGFIIAKVYRHDNEWKFMAVGESCSGNQRTINEIEPTARQFA